MTSARVNAIRQDMKMMRSMRDTIDRQTADLTTLRKRVKLLGEVLEPLLNSPLECCDKGPLGGVSAVVQLPLHQWESIRGHIRTLVERKGV